MDIKQKQAQRVNEYLRHNNVNWDAFDPTPRVLPSADFTKIEAGLIQRVNAINLFLNDIYGHRMILRDGVIPEEFVYSSPAFRTACLDAKPVKRLYVHLTATDVLQDGSGTWYVVEDDLQTPADCIYPHLARKLCRAEAPEQYEMPTLCDNCGLDILLGQLYTDMKEGLEANNDGIVAILDQSGGETPFAVQYLAELTGAVVAKPKELTAMDDAVYYRSGGRGGFQKVSVVHRLEPDSCLDPLCFNGDYTRGVPHLMEAYRRGKVAIINAPGCGVACDRGLYYFMPDMIRYYLLEEPILSNVPTWIPWKEEDRERILDDLRSYIIINVTKEGRGNVTIANRLDDKGLEALKAAIIANPRRYAAQTMLLPQAMERQGENGMIRDTSSYFRALTVCSNSVRIWMGGSTRFRSAGVFQDTWVLSE